MNNYTSCESVTLAGIDARCDNSFGGVKRVLVALRDNVTATIDPNLVDADPSATPPVIAVPNEDELVTKIEMQGSAKFYEFRFRRNTASMTSTATIDPAIGSNYITTELTMQFSKAEAKKRMILQSLIAAGASVIVEDMYGQYIYLGKDQEVVASALTSQTGTAEGDLNGYNVTLSDVSEKLPHFINTNAEDDHYVDISSLI